VKRECKRGTINDQTRKPFGAKAEIRGVSTRFQKAGRGAVGSTKESRSANKETMIKKTCKNLSNSKASLGSAKRPTPALVKDSPGGARDLRKKGFKRQPKPHKEK